MLKLDKSMKILKKSIDPGLVSCFMYKLIRIMKLSVLLLTVATLNIMAEEVYSQNKVFSLNYDMANMGNVLKEIEEQSDYYFLFNQELVDVDAEVSINLQNKRVEEILDYLLKDTDVSYAVFGKQIILSPRKYLEGITNQNQQLTISGIVTDENNLPLIGVNIVIKGTTTGTVTNPDGRYSLEIPSEDVTIVYSSIGYLSEEIIPGSRTEINVSLIPDIKELDEVVVIGYGVQKKSNVTGAISSVKSEELSNRSTSNVASALQGKVSGVQIMNTSGAPGSGSTIRIRGFSSNGVSDPLYIVDGLKVPDIDYLDPDNIESIEILKDGASAAIYGAEAGNGVVLITTKSGGKMGGKIFVNTQNSFSQVAKKMDLLNAEEFINYILEAEPTRSEEFDMFYYNDPSSYVNNKLADTDWQDELFTIGYRQRYSVGFQGGTDKGSLFVSLNYLDHNGIVTGSKDSYKRITGQINGTYKIKKWLDIGITNSIESSKTKNVTENNVLEGSLMSLAYIMDPLTPAEYSDGLIGASSLVQDAVSQGYHPLINQETGNYYGVTHWSDSNPLALLEKDDRYSDNFRINGTFYANISPIKNLVFTSRLGYRFSNSYSYLYTSPNWLTTTTFTTIPDLEVSQLSLKYYQWENFANYNLEIGESTFGVLAGLSFINSTTNYMEVITNELSSLENNYHYLDYSTTTANDEVEGNSTEKAQIAYYGRFTWDFTNRYNLQFNFRADSYDAAYLDLEHNWGYFPSVSAGWTVSNESFMQNRNTDFLSFLKIRAAYGKNGSISNLGGYMYAANLNAGAAEVGEYNYYVNNQLYTGIYPSAYLANPKLRWEESIQFDAGIDIRLFESRLSLTADYFNKNTDGLLIQSTASLTTGTNYVFQNVGLVNNHGFEFDFEWKDLVNKDFSYSVKANLATISNNVDKYKGKGTRIQGSEIAHSKITSTYFEEGYPIWYIRGYKVADIDNATGEPIYEDLDGDEAITDADRTYLGSGIPDFTFGATVSFTYKNFDFVAYATGAYGNEILYGVSRALSHVLQNKPQFVYDERWTSENPEASRTAPFYNTDPIYLNSDAWVFDGSYVKIKQIQFGYNVPSSILERFNASAMRVYVSLDDFFTFTSYPGLDPEVRPNSTTSMAIDFGGYPVAKSVMFGVNLTF